MSVDATEYLPMIEPEPDNIEIVNNIKSLQEQIDELCRLHKDLCMKKYGTPDIPKDSDEWKYMKEQILKEFEKEWSMFFGNNIDEFIKENEMKI